MASKVRRKRKQRGPLVKSHLKEIKRALLEGDKRPAYLEFLRQTNDRRGIYCLYDGKGRLYYVGKASDLPKRLDQHLKDRHSESWDQMTLFFLAGSADVAELEALVVAAANPPGNKQRPKAGVDRRKDLKAFLRQDAVKQIDEAIYPNRPEKDKLAGRITPKKLNSLTQAQLARALGITQSRVSQLIAQDRKKLSILRKYIREGAHRDAMLVLLQKAKVDTG